MDKKLPTTLKPTRKRVLFWVSLIVVFLLSVYSFRYDLILALPSVQVDRLRRVSEDTKLPFPPSSRVVKFGDMPLQGPYRDWQHYWISWLVYWESWRLGARWYHDDMDSWFAKIVIPESSYAQFKEAVSSKRDSPFQDGPSGTWDMVEWTPVNPDLKKIIIGENEVDCIQVIAAKEDGDYAIYVAYECK